MRGTVENGPMGLAVLFLAHRLDIFTKLSWNFDFMQDYESLEV